jgi:trehalose 6-phosphate synthase
LFHDAQRSETLKRRCVIIANRLPVHRAGLGAEGAWESSAGGLVTAMMPVLRAERGTWIGWTGYPGAVPRPFSHDGVRIHPVSISREEIKAFYDGMSNRTFWPLYHDAIRTPEFHREWWKPYLAVNERFARVAARVAKRGDLVWIHDYHLQIVPRMLRFMRPDIRIGFFLHIPFPPEELFEWLPWREDILMGLLGADVIGFQTQKAAQNFSRLARQHTSAEGTDSELTHQDRTIRVASYPISIDFKWFAEHAEQDATKRAAEQIRKQLGQRRRIILAVDRLDYTKGISIRLEAYEELLKRKPHLAEKCVLVQIAVPSRDGVPDYDDMRSVVEQTVGRINGQFSEPGRVAVHYFHRNLTREQLIAYYAAADIALVTPLRDGMNLVAKEYVACRTNNTGVLVLSEFAGAARELRRALLVNPRDRDQMVRVMEAALRMPHDDANQRMSILRMMVRRHDVYDWSQHFLEDLAG